MNSNGLLITMSKLGIETPYRYKLRKYWINRVWADDSMYLTFCIYSILFKLEVLTHEE